jgi:hypothetical protein
MTGRTAVYDTGMVLALLRQKAAATLLHHSLRAAPHRPIVLGPIVAQSWRPEPGVVHALSAHLRDCTVPHARDCEPPFRGHQGASAVCVACMRMSTLDCYKRAGMMLARAELPRKKRPDAVDALVVIAAALHAPSQILTSDPDDINAYLGTLDEVDVAVERI